MLIDMPKIRANIKNKHVAFMSTYGDVVEKVRADHQLLLQTVFARLKFITQCFVEEGVVDRIEEVAEHGNTYHRSLILHKEGFDNTIVLVTDGSVVVMKNSNNIIADIYMFTPKAKRWSKPYKDDFDWAAFSNELLDQIHQSIYERRKASETKIFNDLYNPEA